MNKIQLLNGEYAVENAPQARLEDGRFCVPQHYLKYQHTLASVEELILKLDYCDRYPIFVSEDNQGIYLQIGIIGLDNYADNSYGMANIDDIQHKTQVNEAEVKEETMKIVYGRKWRVEPKLPSSEIVQTAFLALKKAREHEVRELFRLTAFDKVTTPFNSHHDMAMLTNSYQQLQKQEPSKSWQQLQVELDNVCYDHTTFSIANIENRHDKYWLLEVDVLAGKTTQLPEMQQQPLLVLVLSKLTFNELCYQLIAELIRLSDRHVDEHFTFSQVARFSQENDIKAIAKISADTRKLHKSLAESDFEKHWRHENYQVDLTRVPHLNESVFSERIKGLVNTFSGIEGMLPNYR
ncbi:hypothetical protein [Colwellia ponticola]|uniref:Uncharacterized protein n=1 Tax=Colwellia ponticola TaxID=2304625 RepID=A0A8H2JLE5_9GAMM|nr:hypothetical protein [Colwellia ponticola]TMM45048.1 hypothetical protein FCS21_09745 [Colwellia ponticola]